MIDFLSRLSWLHVVAIVVVYMLGLILYRLFFHPLSKFPGPKLAAVTRFYEGYYDIYQNGQYTFKIAELHKSYGKATRPRQTPSDPCIFVLTGKGPIVRISPHELHVIDPAFFDTLYRQDAHYQKYTWATDAFALAGAPVFTADHDLHRARRQPSSPYFSKSRVASSQGLVHKHMDKLLRRLTEYGETGATFDLGAAMTAFARDVVNEFVLGKSYHSLDCEDFDVIMLKTSQGSGGLWRLSKFVRFVNPVVQSLPPSWLAKFTSEELRPFFRQMDEVKRDIKDLMSTIDSSAVDEKTPPTLVHSIMKSKLPPSEKTLQRILDDIFSTTAAGFETTASVLRLVLFHIFSNEEILRRLREELASAGITPEHSPDLKALEQLPYLTAVLHEGMRLNPAIATRMARVSTDHPIIYDQWSIPVGTPVGMTLVLMHADESLYPHHRRFDPDRWIEGGVLKKAGKGFAPFSKGPRVCLGMHLAWAEIYMLVVGLVLRFDFRFPSATAEDFECNSDQFAIGTRGQGHLKATVTSH